MIEPLREQATARPAAAGGRAPTPAGRPAAPVKGAFPSWRGWLTEAGRSLFFRRPRWERIVVAPLPLVALFVLNVVLALGMQYAAFDGPLVFYWQAVAGGWLAPVLLLAACWVVVRDRPPGAHGGSLENQQGVAALFGTLVAQGVWLHALLSVLVLGVLAARSVLSPGARQAAFAVLWYGGSAWTFLAGTLLLGRHAFTRFGWAVAVGAMALVPVLQVWAPEAYFWYPRTPAGGTPPEASDPEPFALTQEIAEAQSAAVVASLDAVQPQRRGIVDLYAITFAPYADEDVFSREAGLVDRVMAERFDAKGRVLRLQNHAATAGILPWATPLNLHRAIDRMAERMDRDDDILFLHLTSHGARDGRLAAAFAPLTVDEVTPEDLKAWLDEAGVRFRVISVSACYSGSWIQPLSGPGTLVMTAADADHTSYGCGRKSELTFFGRAMYDEQLRQTLSFENAHAVARAVIERREKEAGKTDGYSNPQIYVGAAIRAQLAKLEHRLAPASPQPPQLSSSGASAPRR